MFLQYGTRETEYLKSRDKRLGEMIDRIGHVNRAVDTDLFSAVVHQIIGQQISTAAQETLWKRLTARLGRVDADSILSLGKDELQAVGMTYRKAEYIQDFAGKVKNGEFDIAALTAMSDADVAAALSSLKGIGVWTAEMIMIFCMQRPDIVSFGDLAILRGMRMLYRHRSIDREKFEKYRRRYSPCGTVASLYLWAIAGGAIPELSDPAPKKKS
ncbi:MAG: DNA-3-methyladenine glycosylase 2 family protein [Lachnospiraceae bacterium]|nr:DNA-3-methyladenine glycosylase 2 family protein [Lachnospiraceae bacterium]